MSMNWKLCTPLRHKYLFHHACELVDSLTVAIRCTIRELAHNTGCPLNPLHRFRSTSYSVLPFLFNWNSLPTRCDFLGHKSNRRLNAKVMALWRHSSRDVTSQSLLTVPLRCHRWRCKYSYDQRLNELLTADRLRIDIRLEVNKELVAFAFQRSKWFVGTEPTFRVRG